MRPIATALAVLLLTSAAAAQAPLGDRIGPEISRAERDYFGLFPTVRAQFESAALVQRADRLDVVVRRSGLADTTLVVDRGATEALRRFVEAFEQAPVVYLNPGWQEASGPGAARRIEPDVVVPHVDPRSRTRVTVGDRRYDGVVLAASDTLLVLYPLGRPYAWRSPEVVHLLPTDVQRVEVGPRGAERYSRKARIVGALVGLAAAGTDVFLLDGGARAAPVFVGAATAGALVAGGIAPHPPGPGSYADRLPDLRERSAFRVRVPIDFRPVVRPAALLGPGSPQGSPLARRLARWRRDYGLVNVALLGSLDTPFSAVGPRTEFYNSRVPTTETSDVLVGSFRPEAVLDVALRPVPYARLGATWTRGSETLPDGTDEEVAAVTPGALRVYAELVAPSPRAGGFGVDVSVGGGLERTAVAVRGSTNAANTPVTYAVEETSTGRFLQASLDLVTPQRASFFARLTSRSLPTVTVPGETVESDRFPGVVVYRRDAHDVVFGDYREVSFGTRFRF